MFKANIIAVTKEINNDNQTDNIIESCNVLSGKAAGICYGADDYLSNAINNKEAALKRCKFNAKSGHYSVFEHAHVTLTIECSKAFAMILNSTRLYTTSEKSARYTKMKLSDKEQEKYDYWKSTISSLINLYYPDYSDRDVEKLAMENARYMTSVFTPTSMIFTIPYGRLALLPNWLRKEALGISLIKQIEDIDNIKEYYPIIDNYYYPLRDECLEAADVLDELLGSTAEEPILKDHKNINAITLLNFKDINKEYYGDVYISKYKASFAAIAQLQRHRTCNLGIIHENPESTKLECYIPKIIKGTPLQDKWIEDFNSLVEEGIIPQATIMCVTEKGFFEDFVLKCKERLCCRTQLESAMIVEDQLIEFAKGDNLTIPANVSNIKSMIYRDMDNNISVKYRCKFDGYICKEPCTRKNKSNDRLI